ncbi:MAG: class I tRNA ligase family protein, partial [Candidatus Pacebacteria bacterium]|nr:class I tRNA ligase family protein [Candidatus Paceibacterota bacterium]
MKDNDQAKETTAPTKSAQAEREEAVLKFWAEKNIFEKAVAKEAPKGEYVFYEGPPTANAKPALHHLEARAFKDVMPRYKTMQGFHVPRRAGWDTHGLPVELQIEKKLGLKSKKEIEEYGVAKFNKECRESVFEFIGDWEKFTDRIGYWVDKTKAYYTFDTNYVESLWSVVKKVDDQGLLYKDYRVVPWCARCGTALASHELAQGYMDVKDLSVTAKFKIKGQNNAYFLAWTTTPWTLPGNVALAVGVDITYVEAKVGEEIFVLAKERLSILPEGYEIVAEHKGSEMVGMEYEPLYPFLSEIVAATPAVNGKENPEKEKMSAAYKVYAADFVTTEDGTGIVHTAVMYGADDFDLGNKVGLPKFHTVNLEGKFISGTGFLEGRFVKDEDVAVDIIKDLANRPTGSLLFKKEKYEHNYPHCWRCKTPLIYYARDSWYIAMSKLRDELVAENEKINWVPEHIKEGRFGEWVKEVKDWAISRERYWGTPLPVWVAEDGERMIVDSFETLKQHSNGQITKIIFVRHGRSEANDKDLHSVALDLHPLTQLGEEQAERAASILAKEHVDVVFASPILRARQTAAHYTKLSGLEPILDNRLSEITSGSWEEKSNSDSDVQVSRNAYYALSVEDRYVAKRGETGESFADLDARVEDFLDEVLEKYQGKTIVCFAHQGTNSSAIKTLKGVDNEQSVTNIFHNMELVGNGAIATIYVNNASKKELDPHRPYIDDVILSKDGKEFRRVKEVMDVWFDSGSMPFAQDHYPFQNKEWIDTKGYPADFISEAIDQTRGWFYTLLAVGVLMGRGTPYKNVICLGHLLDKDGKKMSKSIGNIVNPWEQMDKYGVDVLRLWMFSVNQPGEGKNYDENVVRELASKTLGLTYNVLAFYELYRDQSLEVSAEKEMQNGTGSKNVLDQWILSRLNQLIAESTTSLDAYRMIEPVRAIRDFIGDMSTWYLRRSRDRLKDTSAENAGDTQSAKQTLYIVLKKLAQLLAPFAPFAAEDIWQKLKNETDAESVHLSEWPVAGVVNDVVLSDMERTRAIVEKALAARQENKIPVRQPLSKLSISENLPAD